MAAKTINILFDGTLIPGFSKEQVIENLMVLFHKQRPAIEQLLSMNGVVLKKDLTESQVEPYVKALNKAGIIVRTQEIEEKPSINKPFVHSAYETPKTEMPSSEMAQESDYAEVPIFSINGRLGRLRYLAWSLIPNIFIIGLIFYYNDSLLANILSIPFFAFNTTLYIRRAHDLNYNGWLGGAAYLAPLLIGCLGIEAVDAAIRPFVFVIGLMFLFKKGTEYENDYGKVPVANTKITVALTVLSVLISLAVLIFLLKEM